MGSTLAVGLTSIGPGIEPASGSGRVSAAPPPRPADTPDVPVDPAAVDAAGAASFLGPQAVVFLVLAVIATGLILHRRWWRLDAVPPPARRLRPDHALLFAVGMMMGSLVLGSLVHAVMGRLPGGAPDPSTLGGALRLGLPVYAIQALVIVLWWTGGRPTPDASPGMGRAAAVGLAGLLLTWPIVVAATTIAALLAMAAGGEPPEAIAHETLARIAADPWRPAALGTILLVTVAVPWIEEAIYRGMLQRGLVGIGLGRWTAVLAVAAIFALRHLGVADPHAVAGLFVLGVGLGVVVERTGRLTAAVVMHAAFNLGNVVLAIAL